VGSRPPVQDGITMGTVAAPYIRRAVSRPVGVLVAVALLAATTVLVNRVFPAWVYPLWNTGVAGALVLLALACGVPMAQLGLRRYTVRRALLVGLLGAASVALTYGVALIVPPLRSVFDDQRAAMGAGTVIFTALVRIPLGTVLLEEVAFRGVLPALFGTDLDQRWRWRPVLAASALFGLWHALPSVGLAGSNAAVGALPGAASPLLVPVLAVIVSAGIGVALCAWRRAGQGLLAPILVHLATNSGGVLLSWWLQR
jgi:uncharacterized protein